VLWPFSARAVTEYVVEDPGTLRKNSARYRLWRILSISVALGQSTTYVTTRYGIYLLRSGIRGLDTKKAPQRRLVGWFESIFRL